MLLNTSALIGRDSNDTQIVMLMKVSGSTTFTSNSVVSLAAFSYMVHVPKEIRNIRADDLLDSEY